MLGFPARVYQLRLCANCFQCPRLSREHSAHEDYENMLNDGMWKDAFLSWNGTLQATSLSLLVKSTPFVISVELHPLSQLRGVHFHLL